MRGPGSRRRGTIVTRAKSPSCSWTREPSFPPFFTVLALIWLSCDGFGMAEEPLGPPTHSKAAEASAALLEGLGESLSGDVRSTTRRTTPTRARDTTPQ